MGTAMKWLWKQVEVICGNEWNPLEKRVETFGESIEKRSKKQDCILFNVNIMLLVSSKILSMRSSNGFIGKKISIDFIVYIILVQFNKTRFKSDGFYTRSSIVRL